MSDKVPNLDKLKQLCDELTNRDEQLKINASALWDILEIISEAKVSLSKIDTEDSKIQKEIKDCASKLEKISCIIAEKGCKKVVQHG
jgi:chromosome segregation ATPase